MSLYKKLGLDSIENLKNLTCCHNAAQITNVDLPLPPSDFYLCQDFPRLLAPRQKLTSTHMNNVVKEVIARLGMMNFCMRLSMLSGYRIANYQLEIVN